MYNPIRHRRQAGFTLPELLIVAFVSALLVGGLAEGLSLFSHELAIVRDEADQGPEEAMALMTDMSRYAWTVEEPVEGQLDVVDALGQMTSFAVSDGMLRVTRPSGVTGDLLPGVASLGIETDDLRRFRDAETVDEESTWWQVPKAGDSEPLQLESGLSFAMGFMLPSPVPDAYDVVEGVDEHTLYASLDSLELSLAYVNKIPADPNIPISGGTPGGKKVSICHVPPGNPDNAHTINVSVNALDAHLAHGDLLGECGPPPDPSTFPAVTIQLFEARAPDDARPVGEALASVSLAGQGLPTGNASWVAMPVGATTHFEHDHSVAECAATTSTGKVVMCHVPPGNPANAHSITISPSAVEAHLAHGDYYGCCGAHESSPSVYTLVLNTTPVPYTFDLSGLGELILPGRAYTLVFSMTGQGILYVDATSAESPTNSGVAQASTAWGDLVPAAASVPFELAGLKSITQTDEFEPVSRVSLALEMESGEMVMGSASVVSQSTVPGLWLGAVPGEVADIDP